jgi:hypothetical protein
MFYRGESHITQNHMEKIEKLCNDLRNIPEFDMKVYEDENWCEGFSEDKYLAHILTWAGWNPKRQEKNGKVSRKRWINVEGIFWRLPTHKRYIIPFLGKINGFYDWSAI